MNELPDFDAQWNFGDPAGSEQSFRALLADCPDAPPEYLLALRTQIARALGLQRKFDEAHALLDEIERALGEAPLPRIRYLLERGRALNSAGRSDDARPLFEAACALAQQQRQDRLAVDAAHMVAITLRGREALEANLRALDMAEVSDQEPARRWRTSLHNNIGWSLHDLGDYERALEHFQHAVELRRKQGAAAPLRIARWAVGRTLRSLGRFSDALALQLELEPASPYVEEEIGECLLALGRTDEARSHFASAYAGLKDDADLQRREPDRLARLAALSASP